MNYGLKNRIFFNKVTILGVGLIGASLALALKKKKLCGHITGYGRTEDNLRKAKKKKIIDSLELDLIKACADSDLIVFSSPVGSFINTAKKIKGSLKKGAIVTDVGSVKGTIVREMEALMPEGVSFVGGHPIAGSEKAGIDKAKANLFSGARCILTPTERTDKISLRMITGLWRKISASVTIMSPEEHDRVYAAVSHLPHIIAYALVNTITDINSAYLKFAGQGFKDTTRIAASSPELWRDICITNRENILWLLNRFKENLDELAGYLQRGETKAIEKKFKKAKESRENVR
ncbi:MAG: prephenate dehydrogenase/arogenate dehydrogenase family protein [Nitrospirae bacterium]|nr:prephenate dehydrogenase/arogenate dehydrogenase family protein [Nitrospirota bacterium]